MFSTNPNRSQPKIVGVALELLGYLSLGDALIDLQERMPDLLKDLQKEIMLCRHLGLYGTDWLLFVLKEAA